MYPENCSANCIECHYKYDRNHVCHDAGNEMNNSHRPSKSVDEELKGGESVSEPVFRKIGPNSCKAVQPLPGIGVHETFLVDSGYVFAKHITPDGTRKHVGPAKSW